MSTRKEFIKQMMLLSGSAGMAWTMPESLKRAVSIDPESGSSFMDAEHVVILMQENRSFDHCYGTLQGVRGYNDRHVIIKPDGNSVWAQSGSKGKTFAPFRFDINDTKITWMGSLPHDRSSQVEAYNNGRHNQWLEAKRSGNSNYHDMPLTMGYYTRQDLPFHYAMADAFTVCDQNFCSAMTSTWPNRLYMWGGTIREEKDRNVKAFITNNIPWGEARWKTFPERLQDHNISWKVYQNDTHAGGGYTDKQEVWLGNYICNLLEWLSQYNVRFTDRYRQGLKKQAEELLKKIHKLEKQLRSLSDSSNRAKRIQKKIAKEKKELADTQNEIIKWSHKNFEKLTEYQKELFYRAFTTNAGDPNYHKLTTLKYREGGKERSLSVPKGDLFYQFRIDVNTGNLPTVSWLVAPERFSDHPSAPWYGSWYTSEVLNILTKNPKVWKKTIFILNYDENDGYFDHIPPFVAPDPKNPKSGKSSSEIKASGAELIGSNPIGLGFRVPMVIASPWSRGGRVCSEIFDQTSTLQFLEKFLQKKYNKNIRADNITPWRRTICGDMTSVFREYKGNKGQHLKFLQRDPYIEKIYDAKFKEVPSDYKNLSDEEIQQINQDAAASPWMPQQEPGTRPSCGLPYELYADGQLTKNKKSLKLTMKAGNMIFGNDSTGSPFKVYAPGKYITSESKKENRRRFEAVHCWDYAVVAGDKIEDRFPLSNFEEKRYHLQLFGPNGFFREFEGDRKDPLLGINCGYEQDEKRPNKLTGNLVIYIKNRSHNNCLIKISDNVYGKASISKKIPISEKKGLY